MVTPIIILYDCEVKEMEQQNSCAECLNLGRAVYCMQCVRMHKGYKDMFRPVSTAAVIPCPYDKNKPETAQPSK